MGTLFEVSGATGSVNFKQKETANLVLENDTSTPGSGVEGQIFWKSDDDVLFVHNGTAFQGIGVGYNRKYAEAVNETPNGIIQNFTVDFAYVVGTTEVTRNGLRMKLGDDYTESSPSSGQITFTTPPITSSIILVSYSRIEAAMLPSMEKFNCVVGTPSSTYTGSTTVFNLPFTFTPGNNALLVYSGGTLMLVGVSNDYVETNSTTITFNSARTSSEVIQFVKLGYNDPTGETNSASNVGTGEGSVFRDKIGTVLNFKTLKQGTGITIADNANDVTITASSPAAGGWLDLTTHVDLQTASSQVRIGDGSATDPALSFLSDVNTGMYHIAADTIGLAVGGVLQASLDSTAFSLIPQLRASDGTITAPGWSFASEPGLGWYRSGTNGINLATNGNARIIVNGTNGRVQIGKVTEARILVAPDAGYTLVDFPIQISDGSAGGPSYAFTNDPNTGMHRSASDTIDFAVGGADRVEITNSTTPLTLYGNANSGTFLRVYNDLFTTATTCGVGLNNQSTSIVGGVYLLKYANGFSGTFSSGINQSNSWAIVEGSDTIARGVIDTGGLTDAFYISGNSGNYTAWSANGVMTITIGGTQPLQAVSGSVRFANGTAGAPSISFDSDTNTGIYRNGADDMIFAVGGLSQLEIRTTDIISGLKHIFYGNIVPSADLSVSNGTNLLRWSDLWAQTIHSGDIELENKWRITEGFKAGHPEEGVMFISPDGKKFKVSMSEVA